MRGKFLYRVGLVTLTLLAIYNFLPMPNFSKQGAESAGFQFRIAGTAHALTSDQINSLAQKWCNANNYNGDSNDFISCTGGYVAGYKGQPLVSDCSNNFGCVPGYKAGQQQAAKDKQNGGNSSGEASALADSWCNTNNYNIDTLDDSACTAGFIAGYNNQTEPQNCQDTAPCPQAFKAGQQQAASSGLSSAAQSACSGESTTSGYKACGQCYDGSKQASDFTGNDKQACQDGINKKNPTPTSTTCEDRSAGAAGELAFLACPILRGIGGLGDDLNNAINTELSFNINQNLNSNVQKAWDIFRAIATSLLIIIMLVMVLSQAIGGPFDAYTVKKLLPKIVIAVLLIQLSWVLSKYLIGVANDFGRGIQDLLAAPFGGTSELQLDKLISNLGGGAASITVAVSTLALIAVSILNPFGALVVLFAVFVAIVVGFGSLLVRQALIIACVIFAPVAFVLWILPGTQNYYKMWWSNFTKMLILFPLISGMIIVGRIFAWIVGGGPGNGNGLATSVMTFGHHISWVTASGTAGPLDLMAVLIGYFGPFFLFPKAFSWGGTALSKASSGVSSLTTKGLSPVKKTLDDMKGRSAWVQGRAARKQELDRRAKIGFAEGLGGTGLRGSAARARLGGIGRPSRERQVREAQVLQGGLAAQQAEDEEVKAATAHANRAIRNMHMDDQDDYAIALSRGVRGRVDENGRLVYQRDSNSNRVFADAAGRRLARDANGDYVDAAGATLRRNARTGEVFDAGGHVIFDSTSAESQVVSDGSRVSRVDRQGGLNEVARLGGEGNMAVIQRRYNDAVQAGTSSDAVQDRAMMNRFAQDNIQKLFPALPHLFKNSDYAVTEDLGRTIGGLEAGHFTSLSSSGMRSMLDTLTHRINTQPNDVNARASMARLVSVYNQAISNPQISGSISADINRDIRDLLQNPLPTTPVGGLPGGVADPLAAVNVANAVTNIRAHVQNDGTVT